MAKQPISAGSATGGEPAGGGGPVIDATTILSLLSTAALLAAAWAASRRWLPAQARTKTRVLFVWHLFDALIHLVFEGSFLYNCFAVWHALPTSFAAAARSPHPDLLLLTPPGVFWLGRADRLYGAAYGSGPFSRLWQEYAKADRRWAGVDLGVVCLEVLTVVVGAPLAAYVCYLLAKWEASEGRKAKSVFFWMAVLATAELYGGWMTFAPEWFTGSPNLDTSNWMYLWVYLFFFNTLWVWFPLWILYECHRHITTALSQVDMVSIVSYLDKKGE